MRMTALFTLGGGLKTPGSTVKRYSTSCGCDERLLRRVVKTTFNQRRKMMRGSLKPLFAQLDQEQGRTAGGHADFLAQPLLTKRPEQLSVQDFIDLTNAVEQEMKG